MISAGKSSDRPSKDIADTMKTNDSNLAYKALTFDRPSFTALVIFHH